MHGGKVYEYTEDSGIPMNAIRDFSANLHPFGPPESVLTAIHSSLDSVGRYPDVRHKQVKNVLSRRFLVPPETIVFGNGASEAM